MISPKAEAMAGTAVAVLLVMLRTATCAPLRRPTRPLHVLAALLAVLRTATCAPLRQPMRPLHVLADADSTPLSPQQLELRMSAGLARFERHLDEWSTTAQHQLQRHLDELRRETRQVATASADSYQEFASPSSALTMPNGTAYSPSEQTPSSSAGASSQQPAKSSDRAHPDHGHAALSEAEEAEERSHASPHGSHHFRSSDLKAPGYADHYGSLPDEIWHSYTFGTGVGNREELRLHGLVEEPRLNISGPPRDAPPHWQVVSHRSIFFLFGLYPFARTTKIHIIKTDFKDLFVQRTANFSAAPLDAVPFLHYVQSTGRVQLLLFLRQTVQISTVLQRGPEASEQLFCLLVDQQTLETREACRPIQLSGGSPTRELLVDAVEDEAGHQSIVLFPVQSTQALVGYRLQKSYVTDLPFSLAMYTSKRVPSTIWRVRLFTVSGRSYALVSYGEPPMDETIEVYRYDTGQLTLIQSLTVSSSVIDVQAFNIGFQHYLALAQLYRISLYTWDGTQFQLLQDDPSPLTYKWTVVPVSSCRHEVVLAKVYSNTYGGGPGRPDLQFYVHDVQTGTFDQVAHVPCRDASGGAGYGLGCFQRPGDELSLGHLLSARTDAATYLLIPSRKHHLLVVRLNVTVHATADPVWQQNQELLQSKADMQAQYEELLAKMERLQGLLSNVVRPDSDQVLHGDFHFLQHVRADALAAPGAAFDQVSMPGLQGDVLHVLAPLTQLERQLALIEVAVQNVSRQLSDVIRKNDTNVVITGEKIVTGHVSVTTLSGAGTVAVDTLAGRNLTALLHDVVTVDSTALITGTKTVAFSLTVLGELTAARLNNHTVSDIVSWQQQSRELRGHYTYRAAALSGGALSATGLVGGVDVEQLVTWSGAGALHVPVDIDTLRAGDLAVDLIGDETPETLFSNVLTSAGGNFTRNVTFSHSATIGEVVVTETLNGENISALLSSVVYTDASETLSALSVENAYINGSLDVLALNGRPFPGPYVTGGSSVTFSANKTFAHLTASAVTAELVGGVRLSELVTLDTDQTIAELRAQSVVVLGDLNVAGTVDGVRIEPGWLDNLLGNGTQTIASDVIFAGDVALDQLVASNVNGGALEAALADLVVPPASGVVTVAGRKHFARDVSAFSVAVDGAVNGAEPANWLTKSTDQYVTGLVHLLGAAFVGNLTVLDEIDGVNFDRLWRDAVRLDSDELQIITGNKTFLDEVVVSALHIDGTVNDIEPSQVLWETGTQIVSGQHSYLGAFQAALLHVYGSDLSVPENVSVGGLDFSELPTIVHQVITNTTHNESLVFDQLIVSDGVATVDRLNGVLVSELVGSLLAPQGGTVAGDWRISQLRVAGAITTAHGAGGLSLRDIADRAVALRAPPVLTAPLTFEQLLVPAAGGVSGQLQLGGEQLQLLLDRLVQQGDVVVLNGSKTLAGGVHILGALSSPSLPLHNVLTVSGAQLLTAPAFFYSDVTVHNQLTVHAAINDAYDVGRLESLFVTGAEEVVVSGHLVFRGDTTVSSVNVSGLLAGVAIADTLSKAVLLSSPSPIVVSSRLNFTAPLTISKLQVPDGIVSGRPLVQYLASVRLVDEDQLIIGGFSASQLVIASGTTHSLTVTGLLNGYETAQLLQSVVLLDGDYNFTGVWTLPALTVGALNVLTLNGQLPANVLRLDAAGALANLTVSGHVHAPHVANVSATTTLNGLHLQRELESLLWLSADRVYGAPLRVAGGALVRGDVYIAGAVNGVDVAEVVPLGRNVTLVGDFEFGVSVSADELLVDGLWDGVNFSQCAAGALYPDTAATLHGRYNFSWVTILNSTGVEVPPEVVSNQTALVLNSLADCQEQFQDFNELFYQQCSLVQNLYDNQRDTYYALRYLDVIQELTWPDLHHVTATLQLRGASGAPLLLVTYSRRSGGCSESQLVHWTSSGLLRRSGAPITATGAVRQWRRLDIDGAVYVVSAAEAEQNCTAPLSAVWRWRNDALHLVQPLYVASSQVVFTEAPLAVPTLLLPAPASGSLWQFVYNNHSRTFVGGPTPSDAELVAARRLPDGALLLVTAQPSGTVSVSVRAAGSGAPLSGVQLGVMTAGALSTFTVRGRVMIAVGDGGWSSLVNTPQGVKIFEYLGDGTHRCVPVQHLQAVAPSSLVDFYAGSLPDQFLAVLERHCGLRLFIDQGESGFVERQRLTLPAAESVALVAPSADAPPHLLVSAGRHLLLLRAQMVGAHVRPLHTDCTPRLAEPQLLT